MIVLGKDKTLDNYFIDENGVITDQFGNIQKVYFCGGDRPIFKGVPIHRIMMYTFYGYRNGKQWDIHHLDENKQNNSLSNLIYLTCSEHTSLHMKGNKNLLGKHLSEETKRKMSEHSVGFKGKHLSEETLKKISESKKGKHWFNDGIRNYFSYTCPDNCKPGKLNKK